jgi:pimeloyl-ACP methyl ester carboxylesterase
LDTYIRQGLSFDVTDIGPTDGRVVILLHGFPEDRHCWDQVAASLVEAGYRVIAPDQRGYSPGARPSGRRSYTAQKLRDDVLALADVAGATRFDLIGHDWGGGVAWDLAARRPERVRSLVALSTPHPRALRDSLFHSRQALRSWYMLFFQLPWLPEMLLRRAGPERAADGLIKAGLDRDTALRYAARMVTRGAMTGPINWYRALPYSARDPISDVKVPTLYIWGDGDAYLTRWAAEATARHVTARYRFEALSGASHWLPSAEPTRITSMILSHLASLDE